MIRHLHHLLHIPHYHHESTFEPYLLYTIPYALKSLITLCPLQTHTPPSLLFHASSFTIIPPSFSHTPAASTIRPICRFFLYPSHVTCIFSPVVCYLYRKENFVYIAFISQQNCRFDTKRNFCVSGKRRDLILQGCLYMFIQDAKDLISAVMSPFEHVLHFMTLYVR